MTDTTISACMMVKNEEELLPGCLESIKGMVDEIILVDTGSTDRTVEIAESFGAKIYFHPWENDFSKHRNQTIKYASGDWLLIIDADERLIPDPGVNKTQVLHTIGKLPSGHNALMIPVRDIDSDETVVNEYMSARFFRNTGDFRYEGIVHNDPIFSGKAINIRGVSLNHHGYHLSRKKMEKKLERTNRLLRKRIRNNPKDVAAHFYLAFNYAFNHQGISSSPEKVVEHCEKCIQLLGPAPRTWHPTYQGIFRTFGKAYYKMGNTKKAEEWFLKGLEAIPDDPDLHFEMSALHIKSADYEGALSHSLKYAEAVKKHHEAPHLSKGRIIHSIGDDCQSEARYIAMTAYLGMGEKDQAEAQFADIQGFISEKPARRKEYLRNLFLAGCNDLLLEHTVLFLSAPPSGDLSLVDPLIEFATTSGRIQETLDHLEIELAGKEVFSGLIPHIAPLLITKGMYADAIEALRKFLANHEKNGGVLTLLAIAYEKEGLAEEARNLYADNINRLGDRDDFVLNAMNFFKRIGDTASLDHAVSILLQQRDHDGLHDDALLFLAEHYFGSAQSDSFLTVSKILFRKHLPAPAGNCTDSGNVAAAYRSLSETLFQNDIIDASLQALNIAWQVSNNPFYLYMIGNIFSDLAQNETALQYYQEALNRNHLTPEILDRMRDSHAALGNNAGVLLCKQLKDKISSA